MDEMNWGDSFISILMTDIIYEGHIYQLVACYLWGMYIQILGNMFSNTITINIIDIKCF